MKWGVVVFPGSNCDYDAYDAFGRILGQDVKYIWHREEDVDGLDGIMLPGGFSYGDYLRSGAIARFSPIMEKVIDFANKGGILIGVCNGFQVLTEAELLPGTLLRNNSLRFICKDLKLRVERNDTQFTSLAEKHQVMTIPIAHNEGNFYLNENELKKLEDRDGVLFRYCDESGNVTDEANPNGSLNNIAGIINEKGNVLGMMPHPERRVDSVIGSTDGRLIFESVIKEFVK